MAFFSPRNTSTDTHLERIAALSAQVLGLSPYPCQMRAAQELRRGRLVEMATGEGKTLVIALAACRAAAQDPVHIVTANDYLAERDSQRMAPLYQATGLRVAFLRPGQSRDERRAAYAADVVYATAHELGFDWLRDNLVLQAQDRVQPRFGIAVIDEVDAVLLDEAQTPLIIAAHRPFDSRALRLACAVVSALEPGLHFTLDEKRRQVALTEAGQAELDRRLRPAGEGELYQLANADLLHGAHAALQARALYRAGRDYLVQNEQLILVDPESGRVLHGRRLAGGIHEALEVLEGIEVGDQQKTLASITYPEFFKLYAKVCGLSGTLLTDRRELQELYGLRVVRVPRNRPDQRRMLPDAVFSSFADKRDQLLRQVRTAHQRGAPVLVGCSSVREAAHLGQFLQEQDVPVRVLSAIRPEEEASIIAHAGEPGAVTVATHMAGRGTDIVLGGPNGEHRERVLAAGGLVVIGMARSALRRVDDQLAGRCGRQGDPGEIQFFIGLDDPLLRFARPVAALMKPARLARLVRSAQERAAAMQLSQRERQERMGGVIAHQRNAFYALRRAVLEQLSPDAPGSTPVLALDEAWSSYLELAQAKQDLFFLKARKSSAFPDYQRELGMDFHRLLEAALDRDARLPAGAEGKAEVLLGQGRWVSRNAACPCGSGARYKHCHGLPVWLS